MTKKTRGSPASPQPITLYKYIDDKGAVYIGNVVLDTLTDECVDAPKEHISTSFTVGFYAIARLIDFLTAADSKMTSYRGKMLSVPLDKISVLSNEEFTQCLHINEFKEKKYI